MHPSTSATTAASTPTTTAIVSTPDPPITPTPPATAMHYKVGQTLQINGTWQITIVSVRTSQGDQHTKPKPGNSFLLINVTMKNISSQPSTISSLKQYTLHDTTGQTYTQTLLNGTASPDGTLPAGGALQGMLTYEVPATIHTYILGFIPAENSQQVIWDVQNSG